MKSEGSMNVYFRYWTEEPLHTVNKSKFDIKLATTDTYTKYMIYADAEKKYAVQLQKKITGCNLVQFTPIWIQQVELKPETKQSVD